MPVMLPVLVLSLGLEPRARRRKCNHMKQDVENEEGKKPEDKGEEEDEDDEK